MMSSSSFCSFSIKLFFDVVGDIENEPAHDETYNKTCAHCKK